MITLLVLKLDILNFLLNLKYLKLIRILGNKLREKDYQFK
jgi:hypothetical protein